MKSINITAYTEDPTQIEALKSVIKAFKIKYRISVAEQEESPYDPEFVAMIKQGEKDLKNGKAIKISLEELDKLCK